MSFANQPRPTNALVVTASCALTTLALSPSAARADAGPPYLTNDPGTPGNGNWEINIGALPAIGRDLAAYQLPQIDANFGLGERVQLTYEIPYVLASRTGEPHTSGWSNALPGVKWRFFDQGGEGWQLSTFPQLETAGSAAAQSRGIAAAGPRLLLPLEVAKTYGAFKVDFEAGYYFPRHGPNESILGLVAGRAVTPRLELDGELYDDHVLGAAPVITLDFGGRYRLHRGFILLFMAGRSLSSGCANEVQFMGYLGIQVLLSDYGRTLTPES